MSVLHSQPLTRPAAPALRSPVYSDQAAKLRALAAGDVPCARVLAVTSGKGGVGKSNVSVNLAIQLAQAGKRVILLDADLGLANADVLLDIQVKANLAHVVARQKELQEVMVDAPGGFKLIGGASGLAKMADLSDMDRQRLICALGELETQCDNIIIDTGAGISPNVLSFTRAADHVLVVTTPEPTAITDAYAAIKVLVRSITGEAVGAHDPHARQISLLVNQVRSPAEGQFVYDRISKVAKQFLGVSVFDAGYVFHDEAVSHAVRQRVPFTLAAPRSNAARCIVQLAGRVDRSVSSAGQRVSFFDRLQRWFKRSV
ncbi:MAG: MinD/ParA family protein [Tepidisphaeraceae bacterium]